MNPAPIKPLISTSDLDKIDVRVGTILAVEDVAHSENARTAACRFRRPRALQTKSNRAYARQVRAQFDIDTMHAVECARVAKIYSGRRDIYSRLSWNALVLLSSPTMPAPVRRGLEARILAGESIGGPDIVRARGNLEPSRPKRADQPAMRAAA